MPALILMYHDLSPVVHSVSREHLPYILSPATFRRQLELIKASSLPVVSVNQWRSMAKPLRGLVPTFDDGHLSNFELALPILSEFGFGATFFITAGRIGKADAMSWPQIRALHSAGMEIGSHTVTHRPPATLSERELRYELLESRRILEDGLGASITSVSSPTGFFNPLMRKVAKETGYQALCFGEIGLVADDGDPFSLNRVAVKRSMSENRFRALLRFDRSILGFMRSQQWVRAKTREALGVKCYLRIRRMLIHASHR
jgi:peptidoglycan/xylan/chitin deacetylase (PgdA/CDA1 family)